MAQPACSICQQSAFLCSDLTTRLMTASEVRQAFKDYGITISEWAERHGVHKASVFQVLYKKQRGHRGNSHAIAVLLRLKNGDLTEWLRVRNSEQRSCDSTVMASA